MHKAACLSLKIKDDIATLTIDCFNKDHSFSLNNIEELNDNIVDLNKHHAIKVLVIKGKDKNFCSGLKQEQLVTLSRNELEKISILGQKTLQNLESSNFITIAAINGSAENAGLELALACDFRIGTDMARLGFTDIKNSIIPSWNTIPRLQSIMKNSLLIEFIFASKLYHAEDAFKMGLLDKVVHHNILDDSIDDFILNITKNGYQTVKTIKSMLKANYQDINSDSLIQFQAELFAKTLID